MWIHLLRLLGIFSTTILHSRILHAVQVLHGGLHHAVLEHGNFLNTDILKGRAVMCLQYDGIFNDYFTANLPVNLSVKKIWKLVKIWWSFHCEFNTFPSGTWVYLLKIYKNIMVPYPEQCYLNKRSHTRNYPNLNIKMLKPVKISKKWG